MLQSHLKKSAALILSLAIAGRILADEPSDQPSVRPMLGLRLKLVPPAPVKPPETEDGSPLLPITNKMTEIVGELADQKTDKPVQERQKEVIGDLEKIIAMLEKQKSKNGSGGSLNPSKPLNDSVIASGPKEGGELINPRSGTRSIGNLPDKLRDQIMQSKTEGFPPGYESLLQSYYQRLAQEKIEDSKPAKPK